MNCRGNFNFHCHNCPKEEPKCWTSEPWEDLSSRQEVLNPNLYLERNYVKEENQEPDSALLKDKAFSAV